MKARRASEPILKVGGENFGIFFVHLKNFESVLGFKIRFAHGDPLSEILDEHMQG